MSALYRIRNGYEWANITIDEQSGTFSAISSFGNFGYTWPPRHRRTTLKNFLAGLDYGYFFGKTAASDGYVFSPEKTVEGLKQTIRESKHWSDTDKDTRNQAWEDAEDLEGYRDVHEFFDGLTQSRAIMKVLGGDYYDVARTEKDPQCVGFWEVIWPKFCEEMKRPAPPDWRLLSVFFALLAVVMGAFAS